MVLSPLLQLASTLSSVTVAEGQAAAQVVLAQAPWEGHQPERSALNNDGSPLQLCITSKADRYGVRLIGDPAYDVISQQQRLMRGKQALKTLLQSSSLVSLRALFAQLLRETLPQTPEVIDQLEVGGMWLATALGSPGVAAYTTAWWGDEHSHWERAATWLNNLLPESELSEAVIRQLSTIAKLSSTAIEGADADTARAKLYFRFSQPTQLSTLGLPLFSTDELTHFIQETVPPTGIAMSGFVMSVGFAVATGAITDVKLDLCGCCRCLSRSPEQWLDLFSSLGTTYGLRIPPLESALTSQPVSVAFVGMGMTQKHQPRLNIYLKADNPAENHDDEHVKNSY